MIRAIGRNGYRELHLLVNKKITIVHKFGEPEVATVIHIGDEAKFRYVDPLGKKKVREDVGKWIYFEDGRMTFVNSESRILVDGKNWPSRQA